MRQEPSVYLRPMQHLLLLHGALGSKGQFTDLEKLLYGKFKTYALGFTGHGRVPSRHHAFTIQNFAHEVLDWMNEKPINTMDIFGYSMVDIWRFGWRVFIRKEWVRFLRWVLS
jgi:pimeloyl-ACP methyl ester carboxylesterase